MSLIKLNLSWNLTNSSIRWQYDNTILVFELIKVQYLFFLFLGQFCLSSTVLCMTSSSFTALKGLCTLPSKAVLPSFLTPDNH